MARWKPADQVRPKEVVGRRLFDKNTGVPEKATLTYNIFFDTRFNEDLSLDRLGDGQPHRDTVKYLTVLADQAADAQNVSFNGWAATQAETMKFMAIKPDIMTVARDGVDNPFHALLDRAAYRERGQAFTLSRSLFFSFLEKGEIIAPLRAPTSQQGGEASDSPV